MAKPGLDRVDPGHLHGFVLLYPALGIITVFLGGVAAWGAFNWSLELANT